MDSFFDAADLAHAADGAETAFLSLVIGRDLDGVTRAEARVVMDRYGASADVAARRLMAKALARCLGDRVVSTEEKNALAYLQILLALSEDDAYALRERYVYPYFQNAAVALMHQGSATDAEIHALQQLAGELRLSVSEFELLFRRAQRDGFAALPDVEP